MTHHYRYPRRAIAVEGGQGATGFVLAAGLLLVAEPAGPIVWVLAAAAALFLVYFGRAVVRSLTRLELDEQGIRALGPLGATIPWDEMCSLRLNHYTTRSDRSGGWMQLEMRGLRRSIRVDSSLTGFTGLATYAGREALRRNRIADAVTRSNLDALGISLNG